MKTKLYGASDDLIEIDGAISEEEQHYGPGSEPEKKENAEHLSDPGVGHYYESMKEESPIRCPKTGNKCLHGIDCFIECKEKKEQTERTEKVIQGYESALKRISQLESRIKELTKYNDELICAAHDSDMKAKELEALNNWPKNKSEQINFFLVNILRLLDKDQTKILADNLVQRSEKQLADINVTQSEENQDELWREVAWLVNQLINNPDGARRELQNRFMITRNPFKP